MVTSNRAGSSGRGLTDTMRRSEKCCPGGAAYLSSRASVTALIRPASSCAISVMRTRPTRVSARDDGNAASSRGNAEKTRVIVQMQDGLAMVLLLPAWCGVRKVRSWTPDTQRRALNVRDESPGCHALRVPEVSRWSWARASGLPGTLCYHGVPGGLQNGNPGLSRLASKTDETGLLSSTIQGLTMSGKAVRYGRAEACTKRLRE